MLLSLLYATAFANGPVDTDIGGRFYLRPQARIHPSFNAGDEDATVGVVVNARGSLDLTRGPFRMALDLQSNSAWGTRETVTSDDTSIGTHRAYVRYQKGSLSITAGRQNIDLHQGRYISDPGWLHTGRSYDGLRIHTTTKQWEAETGAFLISPMIPATSERPEPGWGTWLAHASVSLKTQEVLTSSAYLLLKSVAAEYASVAQDGLNNPRQISPERTMIAPAINVRLDKPLHTVTVDAMGQFGQDGEQEIRAWQLAWVSSHALDMLGEPSLRLTAEQSSGDCDAASCDDGVNSYFDPLYGKHHGLRGMADQAYGSNLRDLAIGFGLKPEPRVRMTTDLHVFSLTNPKGLWMRNGAKLQGLGSIADNDVRLLGVESDTRIAWKPEKGAMFDLGYAWFLPQGVGRELTGDAPQHFLYLRSITEF